MVEVCVTETFESWQEAARELLRREVHPDQVVWQKGPATQFPELVADPAVARAFTVPRRFLEMARAAAASRDPDRWILLYRILWRIVHENRGLLEVARDPDVRQLRALAESEALKETQETQETQEMQEMPEMPEMPAVPTVSTVPTTPTRAAPLPGFEFALAAPPARPSTAARPVAPVPPGADWETLRSSAASCTACELYKNATQMVFGRGPVGARIALVGEGPGDQEDLQGAPFVGPAGEVLDRALAEIGLDRRKVYVTNVVKHFKWEPRGKRRIHQTPRANEIQACRPWLEAELALIKPRVLVCLGSTAAQALIGPQFRITKSRGQFYRSRWAPWVMGTYHPSAVLRAEDPAGSEALYRLLVEDLLQAVTRAARTEDSEAPQQGVGLK